MFIGYAYLPCLLGTSEEYLDGIVLNINTVGSIKDDINNDFYFGDGTHTIDFSRYNEGRICTHEVGHYLNLQHIWGPKTSSDTECNSDFVSDTPTQLKSNFGCPDNTTNTCNAIDPETGTDLRDMYENYMVCTYIYIYV